MSLSLGPLFISVPYLIAFVMSLACGVAAVVVHARELVRARDARDRAKPDRPRS